MKIIRIIFFSLLALSLVTCAGIFIFFQTFDTDQYLHQITRNASLGLGRQVSFGHVGPGLSLRGITLDAGPLIIGDDPDFTVQPFIKVDKISISLDLMALILRREIHITGILLQSLQIHFIRSSQGQINIQSIGKPSLVKSPNGGVVQNLSVVASPSLDVIASETKPRLGRASSSLLSGSPRPSYRMLSVGRNDTIKSMKIQDASISFIDQNQNMPLDIWLTGIDASLNDFSLSKPFQLSFNASPLVLKGIFPGNPDSPVFKNIAGVVQLNMGHLDGNIIFTDGVIKNFNVIKTLFSSMLGAFGGGNINNLLNGQLRSQLGTGDTIIKKVQVQFSIHDKTIFIDDALVQTDIFEFTAKGPVGQGFNMDMQTVLHLNDDVSAALVNEFDGFKYLMDDSKRITVDAGLQGVIPHLKYKPNKDFRKKGKKALMQEGGNILNALLGGK